MSIELSFKVEFQPQEKTPLSLAQGMVVLLEAI